MARTTLRARIDAPRDTVWAVLTASDGWAGWASDLTSSVRAQEGSPHPDGAGAVRVLHAAGVLPLVETVTVFDPDEGRYGYRLRPVPPVRSYLADVQLSEVDGGAATDVVWTVEVTALLPLPGLAAGLAQLVRLVLSRLLADLRREAPRRAVAGAATPTA